MSQGSRVRLTVWSWAGPSASLASPHAHLLQASSASLTCPSSFFSLISQQSPHKGPPNSHPSSISLPVLLPSRSFGSSLPSPQLSPIVCQGYLLRLSLNVSPCTSSSHANPKSLSSRKPPWLTCSSIRELSSGVQIAATTVVAVVYFSDSPTRLKSLGIDAMLNPCLQCEFVD